MDFSATRMFISGDRKRRGKLFPWVVSDYPIVDAIEAGIAKIPNAPVSDNLPSKDDLPAAVPRHMQPDDAPQERLHGR